MTNNEIKMFPNYKKPEDTNLKIKELEQRISDLEELVLNDKPKKAPVNKAK